MLDHLPLTPEILIPQLGDALVDKGLITSVQLRTALDRQSLMRESGVLAPIGKVIVELGYIDQQTLDEAITQHILALRAALQDFKLSPRAQGGTTHSRAARGSRTIGRADQAQSQFCIQYFTRAADTDYAHEGVPGTIALQ